MKVEEIKEEKTDRKKRVIWNKKERRMYLLFICAWKEIFIEKVVDREIYVQMAKFIGSEDKTSYECFTFHDRMKQKYKTYNNIVEHLKEIYKVDQQEIVDERNKIKQMKNRARNKLFETIKSNLKNSSSH